MCINFELILKIDKFFRNMYYDNYKLLIFEAGN